MNLIVGATILFSILSLICLGWYLYEDREGYNGDYAGPAAVGCLCFAVMGYGTLVTHMVLTLMGF